MEKIRWERIAAILFCLLFGTGLCYLIFRFVLPPLLPFFVAWIISLFVRPTAKKLSKKCKLPFRLCSAFLLTAILLLGAWGVWVSAFRLLTELGGFLEQLLSDDHLAQTLEKGLQWLTAHSPFGRFHRENSNGQTDLYQMAYDLIAGCLTTVSSRLPEWIGNLASSLPHFFFTTVVTVLSGFYFCIDGERIAINLTALLPMKLQKKIPYFLNQMRNLAWSYLKTYFVLLLLTFSILLIGFLILGIDYAWLLAILIAIADLLPVIGVGTVLIPWAILQLLQQQFYSGFGLLILYLIIELFRQVAEPRLLGKRLGLHPFLTLFAGYIGFCLFGLIGLLFAPVAAFLFKSVLKTLRPQQTK